MKHNQTTLGHTPGRDYTGQLCSASVISCLFPKIRAMVGRKEPHCLGEQPVTLDRISRGNPWTGVQEKVQVCVSV